MIYMQTSHGDPHAAMGCSTRYMTSTSGRPGYAKKWRPAHSAVYVHSIHQPHPAQANRNTCRLPRQKGMHARLCFFGFGFWSLGLNFNAMPTSSHVTAISCCKCTAQATYLRQYTHQHIIRRCQTALISTRNSSLTGS